MRDGRCSCGGSRIDLLSLKRLRIIVLRRFSALTCGATFSKPRLRPYVRETLLIQTSAEFQFGNYQRFSGASYTNCHYSQYVHSIICNHIHVVFSTAERRALIPDDLLARLWPYIGGVAKHVGAKALAVGGTQDHAHVLLSIPADKSISEVVQKVKANSSRWISEEGRIPLFSWQKGYGAFSVSASGVKPTIDYILGQAGHHRKRNFSQEWKGILHKHGIESAVAEATPE